MSAHYVNAGNIIADRALRVFLHATGSSADGYNTLYNSIAGKSCEQPVIGLSYRTHVASDAGRVQACTAAYGSGRAQCLTDQHADAVWGGNRQPKLWAAIPEEASVSGRLVRLLAYLHKTQPDQVGGRRKLLMQLHALRIAPACILFPAGLGLILVPR